MFTGIIETIGEVISRDPVRGDVRITISAPDFADKNVALGDSVACDGVCLTVVEQHGSEFSFDVSTETMDHSLIGSWVAGKKINLELALLPTTRLGGHIVSGHVDGLATLEKRDEDARSWRMQFRVPEALKKYIAKKGSITINGVSLTVNWVGDDQFDINVIPHTMQVTTLGGLVLGDQVHIEIDLLARYLERLLNSETPRASKLSEQFLSDHGFT